jgi:hydrogenase expression/formation protein HypC
MCIGFPGKIISIDEDNFAIIDISGTRREVSLDLVDDNVIVGDFVICHAGYAIHKIDEAMAKEKLDLLREIIDDFDNDDKSEEETRSGP